MMKKVLAKKKENKGFSLVELIVVVLIIAIIAVALAPQVMKWVDTSKKNVDSNNAASIKSAVFAGIADAQANNVVIVAGQRSVGKQVSGASLIATYSAVIASGADMWDYISSAMGEDRPKTQKNEGFLIDVTTGGGVTISWQDLEGNIQYK